MYSEIALSFLSLHFLMLNKTSSFFFVPQRSCIFRALVIIIAVLLTLSYLFSVPWGPKHRVWEFLCKSSPLLSRFMCLVDIPVCLMMMFDFFCYRVTVYSLTDIQLETRCIYSIAVDSQNAYCESHSHSFLHICPLPQDNSVR